MDTPHPLLGRSRAIRTAICVIGVALLLLIAAPHARAAESYTVSNPASAQQCENETFSSGQTDQRGYLYVACGSLIDIWGPGANPLSAPYQIQTPYFVSDVAPSPDGTIIYADVAEGGGPGLVRYVWNGASYVLDPNWHVASFPYDGGTYAFDGVYIATDAFGNIYGSNGDNPNGIYVSRIVKWSPSGAYVTGFGEYIECGQPAQACSWAPGQFYTVPTGVAVSSDGSKVYVTDKDNSRVQEFDYQTNGSYAFERMWGNTQATDPGRQGRCDAGYFGAPYDVDTDRWGNVYVANTSCKQVDKFTATGTFLTAIDVHDPVADPTNTGWPRDHGLAVDWNGDVWSGETGRFALNNNVQAPPPPVQPLPVADTTPPTLTSLTIPTTVSSKSVTVTVVASDNQGLAKICFVSHIDWATTTCQPWAATVTTTIATNPDTVEAYVVDGAGNESPIVFSNPTTYTAPAAGGGGGAGGGAGGGGGAADTTAPVIASVAVTTPVTSTSVPITITATDNVGVTQMRFVDLNSGNPGPWAAFNAHTTTTIPNVTNDYRIEVQVADAAGNVSNAVLSSDFVYRVGAAAGGGGAGGGAAADATAPVVHAVSLPATSTSELATALITATDNVGVTKLRYATEDGNLGAWQTFTTNTKVAGQMSVQVLLSPGANEKAITVQVEDAAGNVSALDTTAEITAARAFTRCVPCTPPAQMAALVHRQGGLYLTAFSGTWKADRIVVLGPNHVIHADQPDHKVDHITCKGTNNTVYLRPEDHASGCAHVIVVRTKAPVKAPKRAAARKSVREHARS